MNKNRKCTESKQYQRPAAALRSSGRLFHKRGPK